MSATPTPPERTAADAGARSSELEVDLAAFLPDGVALGEPEAEAAESPPLESDLDPVDRPAPVDVAALQQVERELDAVDAAIARLDEGTYGIDPATGLPIDDALLAADPTRLS